MYTFAILIMNSSFLLIFFWDIFEDIYDSSPNTFKRNPTVKKVCTNFWLETTPSVHLSLIFEEYCLKMECRESVCHVNKNPSLPNLHIHTYIKHNLSSRQRSNFKRSTLTQCHILHNFIIPNIGTAHFLHNKRHCHSFHLFFYSSLSLDSVHLYFSQYYLRHQYQIETDEMLDRGRLLQFARQVGVFDRSCQSFLPFLEQVLGEHPHLGDLVVEDGGG